MASARMAGSVMAASCSGVGTVTSVRGLLAGAAPVLAAGEAGDAGVAGGGSEAVGVSIAATAGVPTDGVAGAAVAGAPVAVPAAPGGGASLPGVLTYGVTGIAACWTPVCAAGKAPGAGIGTMGRRAPGPGPNTARQ